VKHPTDLPDPHFIVDGKAIGIKNDVVKLVVVGEESEERPSLIDYPAQNKASAFAISPITREL
jgi:hypothetical protein